MKWNTRLAGQGMLQDEWKQVQNAGVRRCKSHVANPKLCSLIQLRQNGVNTVWLLGDQHTQYENRPETRNRKSCHTDQRVQ